MRLLTLFPLLVSEGRPNERHEDGRVDELVQELLPLRLAVVVEEVLDLRWH